jgi:hypothetical protein
MEMHDETSMVGNSVCSSRVQRVFRSCWSSEALRNGTVGEPDPRKRRVEESRGIDDGEY